MKNFHLELAIEKMQDYFSKQKDVVAAYLFGSYAGRKETSRSDLDIGIVFTQSSTPYRRQFKIANDLEKLIDGPEVEVNEFSSLSSPVFLISALKGGRLICENNPLARRRFEVKVMQEFSDNQKYRSIQYSYLDKRIRGGQYAN